jgi:hypothetical protein
MIVRHASKEMPAEIFGQTDQGLAAAVEKGISGMNQRIRDLARELGLFYSNEEIKFMATVPIGRCRAVGAAVPVARTPRSR